MTSIPSRKQAYEDIFARPSPATGSAGPPPDRRQSPGLPSHHSFQMTPVQQPYYDPYAYPQHAQYERRTSAGAPPMPPPQPTPQYYPQPPPPPPPAQALYQPVPGPSRQTYYPPPASPHVPYPDRTSTISSSSHPSPPTSERERELYYQHTRMPSTGNDLTRDPMLSAYFATPSIHSAHSAENTAMVYSDAEAGPQEWDSFPSDAQYAGDVSPPNGYTGARRGSADSDAHSYINHDGQHLSRHPGGPRPMLPGPHGSSYFSQAPASAGLQRPYSTPGSYGIIQAQTGPLLHRQSTESMRLPPSHQLSFSSSTYDQRSQSMTMGQRPSQMYPAATLQIVTSRRQPVVYPALLSRVAEAFRVRVQLSELSKDGLSYTSAFEGRHAVDVIAFIIKTTDRNLALLLGRALDAQKFFHDVTYDHRLRDSAAEIYQFRERLADRFVSADVRPNVESIEPRQGSGFMLFQDTISPVEPISGSSSAFNSHASLPQRRPSVTDTMLSDEFSVPSGVFTLLTDCYSPTCTRDRLCYSIACPRRLEQQARLKLKPQPGLKRTTSSETLDDDTVGFRRPGENQLWSHIVSKEVLEATPEREVRRQEAINELIYTECDFVRDLEYMRDSWIGGLRKSNVVPKDRLEDFITQVFWNILDVHQVNSKLCDQLLKRQKQYAGQAIERIGDILLENVPNFGPFVAYGAHQLYGKYEFEKEKTSNLSFAKFVDDVERLPESRKLELNGYLTKPTTRLARYPLLLEVVLKHTVDDHPDKTAIPKVVQSIRRILSRVNEESGKSENRFNLQILDSQLVWKQADTYVDLKLRDENRELVFKGNLRRRGGAQGENAELQVFLFDHAVLMVKQKANTKVDQLKVYRKPIPLELLIVTPLEDPNSKSAATRPKSLMSRTSTGTKTLSTTNSNTTALLSSNKNGLGIVFTHLGRRGYQMTLWSPNDVGRKKWLEKIEERQSLLRDRSLIFDTTVISEGYFVGANRVICAAPFDNGDQLAFGTDNGVYLADLRSKRAPIKVVAVASVTQIDVIEEHGILIVLADRAVQTFLIDALDPADAIGASKRAKKISTGANFFKVGHCLNRTLVCIVKSGSVSSTIKAMEPMEQHRGSRKQPILRKLTQNQESLRTFKEFYLPHPADSIHFLKSKLCVGGTRGFEIVDLETLDTQGLLDPSDSKLDFVQKRENSRPLAIYRIDADFLLCYQEYAFYVNKNGWRTRGEWIVHWEGSPTAFAFHKPYVLAFEPTFVEVRHVQTGALMQIIPGPNIRHLFSDTPSSSPPAMMPAYSHVPPPPGYFGPPPFQQGAAPPYQQPQQRQSYYGNGHQQNMQMVGPPPSELTHGASFRGLPMNTARSQILFSMDSGGTICRFSLAAY